MRWQVLPVAAFLATFIVTGPSVAAPGGGGVASAPGALRVILLGIAVDVHLGYVRIAEVIHLQNDSPQIFSEAVAFPLPRGARYVTVHEGLRRPSVEGDRIVARLIVPPGSSHQVTYAYAVAGEGTIGLDRALPLLVERLEVLVVAPADVRSPRLQSAPIIVREGRTYLRASGHNVPAGSLQMTVVGVPKVKQWPAPAATGGLGGLLGLGLGWAVVTFRRAVQVQRPGGGRVDDNRRGRDAPGDSHRT